jgi:diketogulonate reductase-like aldo/keto reductase
MSPWNTANPLSDTQIGRIRAHCQVLVRWSVQHGYVPLPKSVRAERIAQNVDIFGFELDDDEMRRLDTLDERLFTEWEEWGNLDPTELP